jgi:DNA-binding MarR family transcriptional regulator
MAGQGKISDSRPVLSRLPVAEKASVSVVDGCERWCLDIKFLYGRTTLRTMTDPSEPAESPESTATPPPPTPPSAEVSDEVDQIIAAWRRERPDLDVSPLQVLSRVSRLARHLDRRRRQAFSESQLQPWEFDVLTALRRAGPPYRLSPSKLLQQTLVTSGTMTNRIDGLVAKGLVHRDPDPHDRRGVQVSLTPSGLGAVDEAMTHLLAHEHQLLEGLSAAQRDDLSDLLRSLVAPLDERD